MKTVFTDCSQIAHLWANQVQNNARNSGNGNFYFQGKTIYSYGSHFPIAKHVERNGQFATLFTERTYSNTTAKHLNVVSQAASHLNVIYCHNPENSHSQNFEFWLRESESIAKSLLTARKPEKYLSQLATVSYKANKYASFFDLTIPETLTAALAISDKSEFSAYQEKKVLFEKQKAEREAKELKLRHKKELAEWRQGKTHRLYVRDGFDYIRLIDERFETTQGIKVPKELGLRFYAWIKQIISNGGCTTCEYKILDYTVKSVTKDSVVIGCHTIKLSEIEKAYKLAQ